ncbi:MAG TPA: hypothetical protein VK726_07640 [Acetobacteraceae bacterium]|jgi:hypothetical protein|nr:hypothetical protein [Acetobacteraceae bacterium]
MWSPKRGWSDWTWGGSGDGAPFADAASAVTAAVATSMLDDGAAASGQVVVPAAGDDVTGAGIVQPALPANITELQLDGHSYGPTAVYGGNIVEAWQYSTGLGMQVALIDDGFDPVTTTTYGDFPRCYRAILVARDPAT